MTVNAKCYACQLIPGYKNVTTLDCFHVMWLLFLDLKRC